MATKQTVIVLCGGGSGGHITPLLSLAHALKQQRPDCQIVYVGHRGDNFDSLNLPQHDFDFLAFINGGKFRRYHNESWLKQLLDVKTIALNIRDVFRVIKSIQAAYKILQRTRAEVVFAKGGFISVPVGIAARLRRIPIVTHDSDTVPGLANRIVGRWATVRATGMPTKFYKANGAKLIYVGIPLDSKIKPVDKDNLARFKKQIGLTPDNQVVLVAGGGLGSDKVNKMVIAAAAELMRSNLSLHLIHITGQQHLENVRRAYASTLDKAELPRLQTLGFTPEFYAYSGAADLIISRAGATALAEYALQGKACIIIPNPYLTGGHQLKNAEELAKQDAVVLIDENAESDELAAVAGELLADKVRRAQLGLNFHKLAKPGAADKLAAIILDQVESI